MGEKLTDEIFTSYFEIQILVPVGQAHAVQVYNQLNHVKRYPSMVSKIYKVYLPYAMEQTVAKEGHCSTWDPMFTLFRAIFEYATKFRCCLI